MGYISMTDLATLAGLTDVHRLYNLLASGALPRPTHPHGRRHYYTEDEARIFVHRIKRLMGEEEVMLDEPRITKGADGVVLVK